VKPRQWQQECFESFNAWLNERQGDEVFSLEACPGSGKSFMAAWMSDQVINNDQDELSVDHILAVVPWRSIQGDANDGMLAAFAARGLDVRDRFFVAARRQVRQPCPHGVDATVTLYHEVCNQEAVDTLDMWRRGGWRFALVLDEIHHANELNGTWGEYIEQIKRMASITVVMSGTYFRADKAPIKFLKYVDLGRGPVPDTDYSYPLKAGVRDQVVRDASCRYIDAEVELYNRKTDKRYTVLASQITNQSDLAAAKKQALHPASECVRKMIEQSHADLMRLRGRFTDAAYLFTARPGRDHQQEDSHVHKLANKIHEITNIRPVVVTHKDRDPISKIASFRNGSAPYLVAVNMISEGCDIPRIRGIVFCRYTESEMLFRQIVGRAQRILPEDIGSVYAAAQVYVPKFPLMYSFGQNLMGEVEQGQLARVCEVCGEWPCACPCGICNQKPCVCDNERPAPDPDVIGLADSAIWDGGGIDGNDVAERYIDFATDVTSKTLHLLYANVVQVADMARQLEARMQRVAYSQEPSIDRRLAAKKKGSRIMRQIAARLYNNDHRKAWGKEFMSRHQCTWREAAASWPVERLEREAQYLTDRLVEVFKNGK